MNAPETVAAPAKKAVEYVTVLMTDGRSVDFPKSRKTSKFVEVDEANGVATVRFDFVNGETRTFSSAQMSPATALYAMGHGLSQKLGDTYASVKDVDDMVITVDEMAAQLVSDGWRAQSEPGESANGASVVIKALAEVSGKEIPFIKAFLQGKLDKAKAAGEKLSRQDLYNSFRVPGPVADAIKRLEDAKIAKSAKVDAGSLLAEIDAG